MKIRYKNSLVIIFNNNIQTVNNQILELIKVNDSLAFLRSYSKVSEDIMNQDQIAFYGLQLLDKNNFIKENSLYYKDKIILLEDNYWDAIYTIIENNRNFTSKRK